jgi:hypothetical protein
MVVIKELHDAKVQDLPLWLSFDDHEIGDAQRP